VNYDESGNDCKGILVEDGKDNTFYAVFSIYSSSTDNRYISRKTQTNAIKAFDVGLFSTYGIGRSAHVSVIARI
jgi:hypothetical protein